MELTGYSGLKVFSATMSKDRDQLGERITTWIQSRPELRVVRTVVKQSSDHAYHCLSIVVFFAPA